MKIEGKEEWTLQWTQEQQETDEREGKSDQRRTMDLLVEAANALIKGIKMTSDVPEEHVNKRCPMLDIETW